MKEIEITSQTIKPCVDYCTKCVKPNALTFNNSISLSNETQSINIDGKRIKLSNRAFRVLCALLQFNGIPVSFCFLHEYAWPDSLVVRNNLMVAISEIRINLRHTGIKIQNVRGVGYILTSFTEADARIKDTQCLL
jgi:DNA-binding winged helix-turn-helix (wHTH) protein